MVQVLDHQETVNTEDDDDKHSIVSQHAVSTSRRSPSPVVMRCNSNSMVYNIIYLRLCMCVGMSGCFGVGVLACTCLMQPFPHDAYM